MKKALSLVLIAAISLSLLDGCSKKPRMDLKNFEKYALSDLKLEKKDISAKDFNAYYDLDYMVGENDTEATKRDHYAQVYSTAEGNVASTMVMVYTDYQSDEEARAFYDDITQKEINMLETSTDLNYSKDQGDNYLLVLTKQSDMNWQFDCLYIQKDIILYASIVIGTSDIQNINLDWLKGTSAFFADLHLKDPYSLAPEIKNLMKNK